MDIRKTVTLVEEINSEYGASAKPPLRRVAIAAVFKNPLAGKAVGADLAPLIDYSLELGVALTTTALVALRSSPAQLRSYTKAAVVGTGGDLEHGAAMIHPRLGMAMRRTIKRGRVIIPGHAKVGPAGTSVDLLYGPLDQGWDLDAFDSTPVLIHDAPRPDEIVLWIGYATGPRVNARSKGPDQREVDALIASFGNNQVSIADRWNRLVLNLMITWGFGSLHALLTHPLYAGRMRRPEGVSIELLERSSA